MSETKHTPGPLEVGHITDEPATIVISTPTDPAGFSSILCQTVNDDVTNARLLAAAYTSYDRHCGPHAVEAAEGDLLGEALEALRELCKIDWCAGYELREHQHYQLQDVMDKARDILAKANRE